LNKPAFILGVKCEPWRGSIESLAADTQYQDSRKKALKRDKMKCQYCGFQAKKYQETHHIDDDHNNNKENNLLTCCALCHAVFHIGLTGVKGKGVLIYAPEMSQQHINRLTMMTFAFHYGVEASDDFATRNFAQVDEAEYDLLARSNFISKAFGTDEAKNPTWLANMLLSLPEKVYAKRKDLLSGVRLLHIYDGWKLENPKRTEYWGKLLLSRYDQKRKDFKPSDS